MDAGYMYSMKNTDSMKVWRIFFGFFFVWVNCGRRDYAGIFLYLL